MVCGSFLVYFEVVSFIIHWNRGKCCFSPTQKNTGHRNTHFNGFLLWNAAFLKWLEVLWNEDHNNVEILSNIKDISVFQQRFSCYFSNVIQLSCFSEEKPFYPNFISWSYLFFHSFIIIYNFPLYTHVHLHICNCYLFHPFQPILSSLNMACCVL